MEKIMSGADHAKEAAEAGGNNKYIALMIAVLALLLALSEMTGKNAEKSSMQANIEASNLWSFFQAKTIRRAAAIQSAEAMEVDAVGVTDEAKKAAMAKQIDTWKKLAVRLESEPETNEGRRELMARAKAAETKRDYENKKNEALEISSAIFQVAIVIASAGIITGVSALAFLAGGFGLIAAVLMAIGLIAPTILPFV
jgi:Domain of unknown function (DUF4337)